MKMLKHPKIRQLLLWLFLPCYLFAQDGPTYVTYVTAHWDLSKRDGSNDEWLAMAKEYHEKVTMKNDYIIRSAFLTHFFTADNSEVRLVDVYNSWGDIEKAQTRTEELIEAGWPDKAARDAFFDKYDSYMLNVHADEIYRFIPGEKPIVTQSTEELVVLVQERQRAYPEDGTPEEFSALHKEYVENTLHKNPFIVGTRNYIHGWGSDNRDFIDVRVYENMAAFESATEKNDELVEAHWPDEAARKAFFDKYNRYFTGLHADYIFHSIPELRKG